MSNSSSARTSAAAFAPSRALPVLFAFLFGVVLIAGSGFASTPAVHNAAHDQRHAVGFPCH
jgi:cobalt transporter subunit CbtB